jgi:inosine/xanthosine triphosphatase
MLIAVGSLNPSKLEAVRLGFLSYFPDAACEIIGTAAKSGVSNQPMNSEETLTGARNRAKRALELAPEAHYGVGLEGGLQKVHDQWFDIPYIVVRDREGREGMGSTVGMPIVDDVMQLMLEEGVELGIAVDRIHGTVHANHTNGYFGILTGDRITRAKGYGDAVIVALSHLEHQKKEVMKKRLTQGHITK